MSSSDQHEPPVSTIVGRRQAPALQLAIRLSAGMAAAGLIIPGVLGRVAAVTAIAVVTATPLLRVAWLVWRWYQERDRRFMAVGLSLLGVVGLGAMLTVMGVGR